LQAGIHQEILGWSPDGKAFYLNQEHPNITNVLSKYFNVVRKFASWYRQLNIHGWMKLQKGKNQNMMYNPHFHKNMKARDFEAILSFRAAAVENKRKKKKLPKAKKKADGTVAKKKEDKTKKILVTTTKTGKGKKAPILKPPPPPGKKPPPKPPPKIATTSASSSSNKKRKNPPISLVAATDKSKNNDDNKTANKNTPASDKAKRSSASSSRKMFKEHKKLHNLFQKWNMWNLPDGLDIFLKDGKVQQLQTKKQKTDNTDAADVEPEMGGDCTQDEINALLCHEEMPDSVMDKKSDKQALVEFAERVRQDRAQQDILDEIWSSAIAPNVKGKVLPPSKFAKPTNKWRKVQIGDRLGIYWRDDAAFYDAIVQKQQENTSYFHLCYETDGAQEWLDLSRESFRFLVDRKKHEPVGGSNQRRPTRPTLGNVTGGTSRKDNRAQSTKEEKLEPSITLPDNHSHLAPFLRYSWKALGLGSLGGTPSYNKFVRKRDATLPEVSALELLHDVRSLHNRGLSGVLASEDVINNIDTTTNRNRVLVNKLRNLQDQISKNHDESLATKHIPTLKGFRKLTETWNIPTVRENLRTIETQIMKLNKREATILMKCKQKGLY